MSIHFSLAGFDSDDGFSSEEEGATIVSAPRSKRRGWPMTVTVVGTIGEKQRTTLGTFSYLVLCVGHIHGTYLRH